MDSELPRCPNPEIAPEVYNYPILLEKAVASGVGTATDNLTAIQLSAELNNG
jgi:hypothetical protein